MTTMWELVCKYEPHPGDFESFTRRFEFEDFLHFLDVWGYMTNYLRDAEDFERIGEAVGHSLADQNIIYAEASVSPSDYRRHGIDLESMMTAVRRGLDRVTGVSVGLMVDLVRDGSRDRTMDVLRRTIDATSEAAIVGVTIGGPEHGYPPSLFVDHYDMARDAGLGLSAHAGEAAGPEYVWSAIDDLGVDRIGHGVRAVEDPALVDHLVETQRPLEVCPTSNIRTGVVAGWEDHPVLRLIDAGANVSINSDDPTYFGSSVVDDLREVTARTGADPLRLTLNALEASFTDTTTRDLLRAEIEEGWT